MRVTFLTFGSRGDVQPFLALGAALRARNHAVHLAAPARFADMAAHHGIDFTGLPGDISELSRALVDRAGNNPLAMLREMNRFALPLAIEVVAKARAACRQADLIVHTFMMTTTGQLIAKERAIPQISAQLFPIFTPSAAYPSLLAPGANLGPLNRFSHHLSTAIFRASSAMMYQLLRRKHPAIGPAHPGWSAPGDRIPLLLAYSPLVVPPDRHWGPLRITSGYWHADEPNYQPAAELANFLAAGPAPIYIGFGSMVTANAAQLAAHVLDAIRRSGQRAIVQRGWVALTGAESPKIFLLDEAAHSWLFPRMAAIIHHGGAGTTGAALRAGVPSLVVPFGADQPFWGRRVHELGVGPAPLPLRMLSGERLATAIDALGEPRYQARAAQIGARIQAEQGIAEAIQVIESVYQRGAA